MPCLILARPLAPFHVLILSVCVNPCSADPSSSKDANILLDLLEICINQKCQSRDGAESRRYPGQILKKFGQPDCCNTFSLGAFVGLSLRI